MSTKEQPKSNWPAVKSAISDFDRDALLALIRDLYSLSPGNKRFVDTRLRLGEGPLAHYKDLVSECMYPDASRDRPIDGIGWGYHDGLCAEYYSAFPETET